MKKKLIYILCLLVLSGAGKAQFRKYSNEFLNIGAGARALGMGGANIATVRDGTAGYWNPARLAMIDEYPSLSLMHAEYFAGIGKYDFGGVALPIANSGRTIGFSLMRFGVDDIPNTLFLVEPDGTVNYNNIETFSSADYAFLFSMAQVIKETDDVTISVGGNAKIIHRSVGKFAKSWGFGLDAGFSIAADKWKLAAVLRDATTTFNSWTFDFTDREKEVLYMTKNDIPEKSTELTAPRLLLGGAYRFDFSEMLSLSAEASLETTFDGKRNTLIKTDVLSIDPRLGMEFNYNDLLYLRGGVSNFQQALKDGDTTNLQKVWIFQPSIGAGFKINNVGIDYAFTNLANQSSPLYTHVISLNIELRKKD
jgi:hypothetical protein